MKALQQWLTHFSLQKAKTVYAILLIMTFAIGSQIPRIQIDTDPENMLPADNQARMFHNQTKADFVLYDAIVVGAVNNQHQNGVYNVDTLSQLHELTKHTLEVEGVIAADLMSLSEMDNISQLESGGIRFDWLMKDAPQTQQAAMQVKQHVERLPLLNNTLVSGDGKAAAIYVPIADKNQSYQIARDIQQHIDGFSGNTQWHITGLPVAEDRFGYEMFVQMGISAPLAGLTIFVLLFLFFRNIPFISAAMIVAMVTVITTMGLLIAMGYTVHIMSSMIAIFLMPIAVVDSVHIMSEFSDRYKPGTKVKEVLKEVMSNLFTPMLFTSVTSTIGFLSLMLTPIPPVQIFGAFIGFGIMLAFITTIIFIPAYISRMSAESLNKLQQQQHQNKGKPTKLSRFVAKLGEFASKRHGFNIVMFVAVFAVSVVGINKIEINDNPVRWFKEQHPLRVADKVLNEHFAGTYDAYLVFKDSSKQLTVAEIIADVNGSQEVTAFLTELATSISDQVISEQYINATFSIEDQTFNIDNDADIAVLEAVLLKIEQQQQLAKRFTEPKVLTYIEQLQQHLLESGLVGKSNSLADVVKVVNRELNTGEEHDYVLPNDANSVAQTLLQYQSSHRPADLWHFVTPDYRSSLIWMQLTSGDNQDMSKVITLVDQYIKANPLPNNLTADWAGKAYLNVVWQGEMVAGMLDSLMSAFVIVFIMMVLLFRSVVFGILAMLPLTLTITFIYGLIGWVGKDYDMPIAVLSALTLGLSVDFAIHFLERARSTFKETKDISKTFAIMFDEPATAITRNASVIALGFTPLLFAPLVPYITVGVFLASIMAVSALVTLIMLPAVMTKLRKLVFSA